MIACIVRKNAQKRRQSEQPDTYKSDGATFVDSATFDSATFDSNTFDSVTEKKIVFLFIYIKSIAFDAEPNCSLR